MLLRSSPREKYNVETAIIGSGPGGAVTACVLAEAGKEVLLVEEGEYFYQGTCKPFSLEEMAQKYRNRGLTVLLGNPNINYPEGMTVGGGSEINSGFYHRLPSEILRKWKEEFQVQSLEEEDLAPCYERCERELSVSYLQKEASLASKKLFEGARALGWRAQEVPRCLDPSSNDSLSLFCDKKKSMTATFLPKAIQAGCQLLSQTKAIKFQRKGTLWTVVGRHKKEGSVEITAKNIFLAGGAIQTPLLLRRSGVKKNIGNSLQVHPTMKVLAQFPEKVNLEDMGVPVHQVKEFAPHYSFGCSMSARPYLALLLNDHSGIQTSSLLPQWEHMAIYYAMIISEGCGKVRNIPFFEDAFATYHLTLKDLSLLAIALKTLCQLLLRSGAEKLYPSIFSGPILTKHDDLNMIPDGLSRKQASLMTVHLFSSCPMGENKKKCATDSFGKVHDHEGLYIADASLLCSAPGVNPQGTIMAICIRNAIHYLNQRH